MPADLLDETVISSERYRAGERLNIAEKGKRFTCRFIEPGLVSYIDAGADGYELLRQETIEECLNSMLDAPLIVRHVTTRKPVPAGRAQGKVEKVSRDPDSNWFVCEGTVEGEDARREILNGLSPSCGYTALAYGPGGVYHGIPYVREITKIKFHHLAIVPRGRYEDADIRLNSRPQITIGEPVMLKFISQIKKAITGGGEETVEQRGEISPETTIDIGGGQSVKLNDLVSGYIGAKAGKDEKGAAQSECLCGDTDIEVETGKTVKLNELVESYKARNSESAKKAAADKAAEEAKAAETEKLNAAARNKGAQSFRILSVAQERASAQQSTPISSSPGDEKEYLARGKALFGSAPSGKN